MEGTKRPTLLTVLAVLSIIGGVLGFIGAIALITLGLASIATGAGIATFIFGLAYIAISVLALIAGITVMGNKKGCVEWMKKYAMASIAYQVLWVVFTLATGGMVSWGSSVFGLAIGGLILYFIMMNENVKSYANSLQ